MYDDDALPSSSGALPCPLPGIPVQLSTTPPSQSARHVSRLLRYKWSSKPANHEFVFQPYFRSSLSIFGRPLLLLSAVQLKLLTLVVVHAPSSVELQLRLQLRLQAPGSSMHRHRTATMPVEACQCLIMLNDPSDPTVFKSPLPPYCLVKA